MTEKPIFVATHPRACSTAFERVFMTQRDTLKCIHEPFGDAFYFGPERLGGRYEADEKARVESGFAKSTYQTILDRLERESEEGKRLFIKDITHYLVPPNKQPASVAPSLVDHKRGVGTSHVLNAANSGFFGAPFPYETESEPENPTVIPEAILRKFHFTFLIRHPRHSIPSYFRCTIPPLDDVTGFHNFDPSEAGYDELRRVFDFLRSRGQVGPAIAGDIGQGNGVDSKEKANGTVDNGPVEICVIDADDLLDDPEGIIRQYCKTVGLKFHPNMLVWDTEEDHRQAVDAFEKWRGFHDDAIESAALKPRAHKHKEKDEEDEFVEWIEKYGEEAAEVIRETVRRNVADYEYLKQFAIKPNV